MKFKNLPPEINILLRKNISKGQLIGYSIANIIGLTVILAGILFYCDSHSSGKEKDGFFSDDYIVISKKVNGINMEPVTFSESEIGNICQQTWVKKIGKFTASDFSVTASLDMGGRGISTYLFFESVPDEFFDHTPNDWNFIPENNFVPVVVNRDYLALYNFGFAIPQGLPQLSEELISSVPLKLRLFGDNGQDIILDAAVVGFSSRLNTIAVPQEFMDWANQTLSSGNSQSPSRLILKIDKLESVAMENFMKEHDYEIAGDKEGDSKLSAFFNLVSGIMTGSGLLISLLAIFILVLSIFLLLQKSRSMIGNILLLGYSPVEIAHYYERAVISLNSLITCIAIGLTFLGRLIWMNPLKTLGLREGSVLPMIISAFIYFVILATLNIWIIHKHIFKISLLSSR